MLTNHPFAVNAIIPTLHAFADSVPAISEQRLSKVHPKLASRVRTMAELLSQSGIEIMITQGLRTWAEQDALYAKGRTIAPIGKPYIVTQSRGGESFHNFGLAVDIVILDALRKADWGTAHPGWTAAGEIGQSLGLTWGGAWKTFKDIPHFEYTNGLTLKNCQELYAGGGIGAVWIKVV